ncbi:MAG TPA: MEDS domain-containing protein [Terracidiphilus sp.]|jgi:hypothetical protein
MTQASRHQCLIYDGPPSRQLPAIASVICERLKHNRRCLYLNSPPMVSGIKSYLAAQGIDVAYETEKGSLGLSSDQHHLVGDWTFDVDRMMEVLKRALDQAMSDGYEGLWASGDMTWEFGRAKDLSKLLEYEWHLEDFLRTHPQMGGICQYHAETLPRDILRKGLLAHSHLFVNQTLSMVNPHYLHNGPFVHAATADPQLDHAIDSHLNQQSLN